MFVRCRMLNCAVLISSATFRRKRDQPCGCHFDTPPSSEGTQQEEGAKGWSFNNTAGGSLTKRGDRQPCFACPSIAFVIQT